MNQSINASSTPHVTTTELRQTETQLRILHLKTGVQGSADRNVSESLSTPVNQYLQSIDNNISLLNPYGYIVLYRYFYLISSTYINKYSTLIYQNLQD